MIKRDILMKISITLWITKQAGVKSHSPNLRFKCLSATGLALYSVCQAYFFLHIQINKTCTIGEFICRSELERKSARVGHPI